jgi:hypothetical protein
MEETYSQAQKREFDAKYAKEVLGFEEDVIRVNSHLNPGQEKKIRVFKDSAGLIKFFLDPSGEFQKCYSNGKDDSDGLAEPLPPYSASLALTIDTLVRLGFVIWPCLPERDGRDGVMFVHHEHGIMDAEAFHLLNISGLTYQNAAVGAVVSAIMYVNGDLPPVCDPMGEDVEIDPDDFL